MFTGRLSLNTINNSLSPKNIRRLAQADKLVARDDLKVLPDKYQDEKESENRTGFIILRLDKASLTERTDDMESVLDVAKFLKLEGLSKIIDEFDLGKGPRHVNSVSPKKLRELEARARKSEFPPLRSLLSYWRLDARKNVEKMDEIIKHLRSLPGVADAYAHVGGDDPAVSPGNDPYSALQGHLDAAPVGIDARWAWTQPNSCGGGIAVTDMEQGWLITHEDLTGASPSVIFGDNRSSSFDHGGAVLGEMVAQDNTVGVVGIAPDAGPVSCASHWDATLSVNGLVAEAVVAAIDILSPGDALVIEIQTNFRPADIIDDWFDAIRLASALGIMVFEAAGNGGANLDTFAQTAGGPQILNRNSANFRDSGAIMVGCCLSPLPHNRKSASNFGNRIDCFAWGEDVVTTAYGTLDNGGGDVNREYASSFQNTSAATPIVTGAGLIVQGMHFATTGTRLSPAQMRLLLSNPATGTAQGGGVAGNIGIMPDLRTIIEDTLGLNADVYLRDNIGDDGSVPTSGGISASPDIIVRPNSVANPQVAFGEGSGTETSTTLGFKVEAGQDNFIYARMKNRGTIDANDVTARIFWSPASTLVTPDLWTEIGVTPPVDVPMGDTLEVADVLVWDKDDVPAEGHYCFVGILDHAADPAPQLPAFTDFDAFRNFIRGQNNVTWRNFNVVDELDDPSADPWALPFLMGNFPDQRRYFEFVIERRLPKEVKVILEVPLEIANAFLKGMDMDKKVEKEGSVARITLPSASRIVIPRVLLAPKAKPKCRFIVEGLSKHGRPGNSISIGQFYKEEELGRVTWRFDKKRDPKKICQFVEADI